MTAKREISYKEEKLPIYVMEQLAAREIPAFFPASFICADDECKGFFETGGYQSLARIDLLPAGVLLAVICRLLEMMIENERHYLPIGSYVFSEETVYVDMQGKKPKLVYIPAEEGKKGTGQIEQLLRGCRKKVSEEALPYIDTMITYLQQDDMHYSRIIRQGQLLQQEIYACDIS